MQLTLNSKAITGNISDRLINLTMTHNRVFEADQLDIELDDTDGLAERNGDAASVKAGKPLMLMLMLMQGVA